MRTYQCSLTVLSRELETKEKGREERFHGYFQNSVKKDLIFCLSDLCMAEEKSL